MQNLNDRPIRSIKDTLEDPATVLTNAELKEYILFLLDFIILVDDRGHERANKLNYDFLMVKKDT